MIAKQEKKQIHQEITINEALQIFKEKGIINCPEYWIMACQVVNYLDALLIKTAIALKG